VAARRPQEEGEERGGDGRGEEDERAHERILCTDRFRGPFAYRGNDPIWPGMA
jgi:hypothetical protein